MREKAAVLVVEDSAMFLEANVRILKKSGYDVLAAQTLAAAREHLKNHIPDIVVLDILLPDGNGLDFIREIRSKTNSPVLLVTSLDSKEERLLGFRAGGDDYITKPFDLDELAMRVSVLLRREAMYQRSSAREFTKGPFRLDTLSGTAFLNDREMSLTQKEFQVLLLLVRNGGRVLTKKYIYEAVWRAPMSGDDRTVRTTISRLRKKLDNEDSVLIESRREEGYQLFIYG